MTESEIFISEDAHNDFKETIDARIRYSEDKLSTQRARWEKNYLACTAYIVRDTITERREKLKDEYLKAYEQNDALNDLFYAALPVELAIPYTYAVVHTVCTVLVSQFTSQRPYFPITPIDFMPDSIERAKMLETLVQFQLDYSNWRSELHKVVQSAAITGCGPLLANWEELVKRRRRPQVSQDINGQPVVMKTVEDVTVFSGNKVQAIDPFYYLPDPRVPMHRGHMDGEFQFWIDYAPRYQLKMDRQYADIDLVKDYEYVENRTQFNNTKFGVEHVSSNASDGSQGVWFNGQKNFQDGEFVQICQGTIVLSNAEVKRFVKKSYMDNWNVDAIQSDGYQLYLITLCNRNRIIQLQPFDYDHGFHPVVVMEPTIIGNTFGSASVVDLVYDFEKIISWLFNSRVNNVQQILNSKVFYNADSVSADDMSDPSKIYIPVKSSLYGTTAESAAHNFQRADVTATNLSQIQQVITLVEMIIGTSPIIMGQPMPSGRRTAAESRISSQAGYNRINHIGTLAAAQALQPLGQIMIDNIQQFMNTPFTAGSDGSVINPVDILGDYRTTITDATQPVDPTTMVQTWAELLQFALKDETLRSATDIIGMYSDLGTLSGFRNFSQRVNRNVTPVTPNNIVPGGQRGGKPNLNAIEGGRLPSEGGQS